MDKRLGVGLEALFGSLEENNEDSVEKVSLDLIQIAKWQPRKVFDQNALEELALSIKEYGVLQPIILKKHDDHYEIIAGERRFRASKIAGLHFIPAIIVDFDDQKALEVSMIENLQRKDLSPIEKAEGFEFLIQKLNMTQEELSAKLGFSRSYIANFLRINGLNSEIKEKIASGDLTIGHAKVLASKKNADELAEQVIKNKLTVRQLEELSSKVKIKPLEDLSASVKTSKNSKKNVELQQFESMICEALKVKNVEIIMIDKASGRVVINFEDLLKLDSIISKICF